jgi:hypothetical protein
VGRKTFLDNSIIFRYLEWLPQFHSPKTPPQTRPRLAGWAEQAAKRVWIFGFGMSESMPQRRKWLREQSCFWMKGPKGIPQGLKPTLIRLVLYRG